MNQYNEFLVGTWYLVLGHFEIFPSSSLTTPLLENFLM